MDTEQIVRESVRSQAVMKSAARLIPGGVNSPVRAYRAVGGVPPVIAKGAGAIITDIDGNEYVYHVCSWGALILGHADDRVVVAVDQAAATGNAARLSSLPPARHMEYISPYPAFVSASAPARRPCSSKNRGPSCGPASRPRRT